MNTLLMVLLLYCVFSYLVCGYVAFWHNDPGIKKVDPTLRVLFWLISPIIVFDVLLERLFGWSFLP